MGLAVLAGTSATSARTVAEPDARAASRAEQPSPQPADALPALTGTVQRNAAPAVSSTAEKPAIAPSAPAVLPSLEQAGLLAQRVRSETPAGFGLPGLQSLAAKYPRHAEAWQFGWGAFNETENRVTQFTSLPRFTGSAWQGGDVLPDAELGFVSLAAEGGHSGNDQHAAIRRWTAPRSGFAAISGKLHHPSEDGDGVRGRIICSRAGLLGEWPVKHREAATDVPRIEVQAGDTIDFIADCFGDHGYDAFAWYVQIRLCDAQDRQIDCWTSAGDFHGPLGSSLPQQIAYAWRIAYEREATPDELESACQFVADQLAALPGGEDKTDRELTALTSLCQQLLSSNELRLQDVQLGRD
jgi:hypothetical protein